LFDASGLSALAERWIAATGRADHITYKRGIRFDGVAQTRAEFTGIVDFPDVQHGLSRIQAATESFGRLPKVVKTSFENEMGLPSAI
jgi:hypothetical protein